MTMRDELARALQAYVDEMTAAERERRERAERRVIQLAAELQAAKRTIEAMRAAPVLHGPRDWRDP